MGKRFRRFHRISLTASTAKVIQKYLVDNTLDTHYGQCVKVYGTVQEAEHALGGCRHTEHQVIDTARFLESALDIKKKRATLQLTCPFATEDHEEHRQFLLTVAWHIDGLARFHKDLPQQTNDAIHRIASEICRYANRTEMEVLAEHALD